MKFLGNYSIIYVSKTDKEEIVMEKIKRFFSEYGEIIGKIIINHIAMAIFGIIVIIATGKIPVLQHVAGIVAILMYMFLLYMIMWELGAKHHVRVDNGEKKDKLLGLKISLVANSVFILISTVEFVLYFFTTANMESAVYNIWTHLTIIMQFIYGMYLSISSLILDFPATHILLALPAIICCTLSYIAGVSGKKCLVPDRKKDAQNKRR